MSQASPVRLSRRVAARRPQIVDSSDEDEHQQAQQARSDDNEDDEDDFTPAPQKSPRRTARREGLKSAAIAPRSRPRVRASVAPSDIDPSEVFDPDSIVAPEPPSPTRRTTATRPPRRSVRASRRISVASDATATDVRDATLTPPTPIKEELVLPSGTPIAPAAVLPLGEISGNAINAPVQPDAGKTEPAAQVRPKPSFEKPMDIVVRARQLAATTPQEIPTAPKARTVIKYLVLTNFKSYAGRQVVGPFHTSFSSVVGPNGSGKSNVIDSLLFVFGFRASKMRQGKISALIHNSAAFPDLDHCEVEVHFQEVFDKPGGTTELVEASDLVISRKAFKNNSSRYYINSAATDFTSVTTLLKDRGVDLDHKRFLILQGEVESIAQMKPKAGNEHEDGLLEYLEDIIGTSKYKTPIEESATEVEALNEICAEKNTRVQHVEKEKKGLEAKKDIALAYIRDENDLCLKQSALYQIYLAECEDNIEVTQDAVKDMQAQLDAEREKHKGRQDGINALQRQHAIDMKAYERSKKHTQTILDQLAKLDRESVKYEERRKHVMGKAKKLEKAKSTNHAAFLESSAHLERTTEDLERNTLRLSQLEEEMKVEEEALARVRESLQGKTQGLSDEISAKQRTLEPWVQQISEKQAAITVAQSELAMLQEGGNASAEAMADTQAKIARLTAEKAEKLETMEDCKKQLKDAEKRSKQLQATIDQLAKQEPPLRSKVSTARQKVDEARASFSASKSQGDVLSGLMRLKESGRISGFHGRLGNLGAIDEKYDIAISTACPALENLVVDSVEVGQQCIEYLRKNNLGRANLILLDRLAKRDLTPIKTPENVPRLFDLVRAKDDKFQPAFYSVLQNTLVAETLEQANRIAYGAQRWRVVTLDGQLIDKSGTMSGGGARVARGKMSSKIVAEMTKEQVTKYEVDQSAQEKTLTEFLAEQQEATAQLQQANDEIPHLQTAIQKTVLGIESIDRNLADAQQRVSELSTTKTASSTETSRVKSLQKSISMLEREVGKLQEETAGLEQEIKALQDKIMEVGGVKLRSQKARVDGLKEQVDSLNDEMANAEATRSKTAKAKAKQLKARDDANAELDLLAAELEKVDEEGKGQARDMSGFRKEAEEAKEALDTKNEEVQALKKQIDALVAELNETRSVEEEMRNQVEENQKALQENQKRHRYWQEKMNKLELQNVDDLGEETGCHSLTTYSRDELGDFDKDLLKGEIAILEEKTQNVNVELGVLAEYRRRVEEHSARSNDLASAVTSRDAAKKRCEELRRLRLEGFMTGFSSISLRLKEMYQMITMGGNAELELVDSLDPFSEGILFSVMPPKKSWKNIANLSGGEKTLSSLALVFALHHYKPTPLYVMDEIDAALDFRNVSIVASYIKERTKNAQFIVISLRNNMFELACRLVGIFKVNHMTKSVTIENKDYIQRGREQIKAQGQTQSLASR